MQYLRVKNWEEFQHYKDRNPPWIKLHRALLDDFEFSQLPDETKAHLVLIWLFASQSGGRVPAERTFLSSKLGARKPINLELLVSSGFLIPEPRASDSASDPVAQRVQEDSEALALARSQEERRKATEERTKAAEERAAPTDEHRRLAADLELDCDAEWAQFWDRVDAKGQAWFKRAKPAFSNWLRNARKFADRDGTLPRGSRGPPADASFRAQAKANMDAITGVSNGRTAAINGTAERVGGGALPPDADRLRLEAGLDVGRRAAG